MNRKYDSITKSTVRLVAVLIVLICAAIIVACVGRSNLNKHKEAGIIVTGEADTYEAPLNDESSIAGESTAPPPPKPLTYNEKMNIIENSSEYPEDMVNFARIFPQTVDYVMSYPEKKNVVPVINITSELNEASVPLFIQWDERWGYLPYGSGLIGYTGCGPTALSMVVVHLTQNTDWSPDKVAEFASQSGYCVPGSGSSWTLISKGSASLGVTAKELPLWEPTMKRELDKGHPLIIVVGPGDFTPGGHFLVITGYNQEGFTVNDPNSLENSSRAWDYDTLKPQIKNIWAMSKPE